MDLTYSEEHEAYRAEVRAFVEANWPPADTDTPSPEQERAFRELAVERGYLYRDVPKDLGGSQQPDDVIQERIIKEEFVAREAPGYIGLPGPAMLAPTMLEWGTPELCQRFIPPTLRLELTWCQGYSEPGAGSDLAAVASRAELDGDEFVVNGHKVWTSNAHTADFMFGLFRTEPEASKHAGLSYLLIDMKSDGISVSPLRQMNGSLEFNEVHFSDVRVPADQILGKRGEGWKVSRSTLVHERKLIGDENYTRRLFTGLLEIAREARLGGRPAIEDPGIRRELSRIEGYLEAQNHTNLRQLSAIAKGDQLKVMVPMLITKLHSTNLTQRMTRLAADLIGDQNLLMPNEEEAEAYRPELTAAAWVSQYMFAIATSIAGGASNIQRNIIGERALGLPRDLRAPK